jgi:hypothetical protein
MRRISADLQTYKASSENRILTLKKSKKGRRIMMQELQMDMYMNWNHISWIDHMISWWCDWKVIYYGLLTKQEYLHHLFHHQLHTAMLSCHLDPWLVNRPPYIETEKGGETCLFVFWHHSRPFPVFKTWRKVQSILILDKLRDLIEVK